MALPLVWLASKVQRRGAGWLGDGAETASCSRVRVFCEAFTAFSRSCGCGDIESRCGGQSLSCDCERHLVHGGGIVVQKHSTRGELEIPSSAYTQLSLSIHHPPSFAIHSISYSSATTGFQHAISQQIHHPRHPTSPTSP
ncbi:hypothetical protein FA95DRAFT_1562984 [Auriscalpium vulgare]|uniref:Uncharacterized protein n=1 Tax=Auriscalpium vulgare TaxID=40419 RepID=A0ACB8RJF1_9AGAM|nr:hypothetical protein FA95DRAFT_1562984 [Auriscalpium vulgare]